MRLAILIVCALGASAHATTLDEGKLDKKEPAAASFRMIQAQSLRVVAPDNDNGKHLDVSWKLAPPVGAITVVVRHAATPGLDLTIPALPEKPAAGDDLGGGWTLVYAGDADLAVTADVSPETPYVFGVANAALVGDAWRTSTPVWHEPVTPEAAVFHTGRWFFLAVIGFTGIAFFAYLGYARRNADKIFIRRIPGVDAIEESIGRSTEMGRPVLYVTGIEEIVDIQTIASLLILGPVAELTAEYDTEIKVANTYPMTMIVAEEIVRQGYANAGRLDAHKPENVMFLTSEQFAFAAAVNGMILRDKPATNIYFGRFFAESLLLAETGYLTGAVQIAGTCEFTQLPFFIAACDYTLLGEELYAVGAYLSREPTLLTQLKVGDMVKLLIMVLIVVGVIGMTTGAFDLGKFLIP